MSMGRAGRDVEIKDRPSSSQGDLLQEPRQRKQSSGGQRGGRRPPSPARWPRRAEVASPPCPCPDGEGSNCHLGGDAAAQPGPPLPQLERQPRHPHSHSRLPHPGNGTLAGTWTRHCTPWHLTLSPCPATAPGPPAGQDRDAASAAGARGVTHVWGSPRGVTGGLSPALGSPARG